MIEPIVAVICLTVFSQAAPQISIACAQVPKNPYAGQIGSEYLDIPGCDGSSGIGTVPIDNLAGSSPSTSSKGTPPVDHSSVVPDSKSSQSTNESTSSTSSSATSNSIVSDVGRGDNMGQLYKSSITRYGQGPPGTPGTDMHCQAHEGSCGNNPKSGFTAAASQFLYFNGSTGVGSKGNTGGGSGGMVCGTCWKIDGGNDASGKPISSTPIVVMITNECAAQDPGQPVNLCGMASLTETNSMGMNVNIDLCMDSGATQAFWGQPPWGTTTGQAQQVDCSEWCGVYEDGTKSGPDGCQAPAATWAVTT